jgi:demethylmenaquinone methyltransferase/2-methoxy-6-polyprenyl-1,4-benzoquinol methylase
MFDGIAGRYDLLNRIISLGLDRRWRKRMVAALELAPGSQVLDLATGTADVAFEVLRQHPQATVVGLDPSAGMLEVGQRKAVAAGLATRLELRQGRAEELPFDKDRFDALTIAFGIRNVADRAAGLGEIARVVRPGGRVAILEGSEPPKGLLGFGARLHLHHLVPRLGAWLSGGEEYRYLQASIAAFPTPEEFAEQMRTAGLQVVAIEPLTFGVCHLYVATPVEGA